MKIQIRKQETKGLLLVDEDRLVGDVETNAPFRSSMFGIAIRNGGDFDKKAFYLSDDYEWIVGEDGSDGSQILVPLKRR